jgi:thiamine monophosphate kinase
VRLAEPWKRQFPELRLSRIGKVIPGKEVLLREGRELQPLTLDGYKHF